MDGFAEGIAFKDVITLPWAAGFSAFGAACAEYMHRYDRGLRVLIPAQASDENLRATACHIDRAWRELASDARREMAELKPGNIIAGPAIIRDPMTTVVIPPAKEMWIDAFMILHYRTLKDTP